MRVNIIIDVYKISIGIKPEIWLVSSRKRYLPATLTIIGVLLTTTSID